MGSGAVSGPQLQAGLCSPGNYQHINIEMRSDIDSESAMWGSWWKGFSRQRKQLRQTGNCLLARFGNSKEVDVTGTEGEGAK